MTISKEINEGTEWNCDLCFRGTKKLPYEQSGHRGEREKTKAIIKVGDKVKIKAIIKSTLQVKMFKLKKWIPL